MIKLNRITDYAVVVLAQMARKPDTVVTAGQLAQESAIPEPTVAKVLKGLAREGVLESHRGANGGYALADEPRSISMLQIILALEGPISLTECIDDTAGECTVESLCPMRGNWDRVNQAIRDALQGVTLEEMAIPSLSFEPPASPRAEATEG